jgi:hypothetical protein
MTRTIDTQQWQLLGLSQSQTTDHQWITMALTLNSLLINNLPTTIKKPVPLIILLRVRGALATS